MRRLLLRRLGQLVIVLLLVSFLTLLMLRLLPVDPAYAIYGQNATKAQVAQVHHQLGLDQPLLVQYGHWLGQVLTPAPRRQSDAGDHQQPIDPVDDEDGIARIPAPAERRENRDRISG